MRHDSIRNAEVNKLSYVANLSADGESCMFDRAGLLYVSDRGIVATVLDNGQWVYNTYTWADIGIEETDGIVLYGISNDRIIFPGDFLTVWETETH